MNNEENKVTGGEAEYGRMERLPNIGSRFLPDLTLSTWNRNELSEDEAKYRNALAQASRRMLMETDLSKTDEDGARVLFSSVTKGIWGLPDEDGSFVFGQRRAKSMRQNVEMLRDVFNGNFDRIYNPEYAQFVQMSREEQLKYAQEHETDWNAVKSTALDEERGAGLGSFLGAVWDMVKAGVRQTAATDAMMPPERIDYGKAQAESANAARTVAATAKDAFVEESPESRRAREDDTINDYRRKLERSQPLASLLQYSCLLSARANDVLVKSLATGRLDADGVKALDSRQEQQTLIAAYETVRGDAKEGDVFGIPMDFEKGTDIGNRLQMMAHAAWHSVLDLGKSAWYTAEDLWHYGKLKSIRDREIREEADYQYRLARQISRAEEQELPEGGFVAQMFQGLAENWHWWIPYGRMAHGAAGFAKAKAALAGVKGEIGAAKAGLAAVRGTTLLPYATDAKSTYEGLMRLAATEKRYAENLRRLYKAARQQKVMKAVWGGEFVAAKYAALSSFMQEFLEVSDASGIPREDSTLVAVAAAFANERIEQWALPWVKGEMTPNQIAGTSVRNFLGTARKGDRWKLLEKRFLQNVAAGKKIAFDETCEEIAQQLATDHGISMAKAIQASGTDPDEATGELIKAFSITKDDIKSALSTAANMLPMATGYFLFQGEGERRRMWIKQQLNRMNPFIDNRERMRRMLETDGTAGMLMRFLQLHGQAVLFERGRQMFGEKAEKADGKDGESGEYLGTPPKAPTVITATVEGEKTEPADGQNGANAERKAGDVLAESRAMGKIDRARQIVASGEYDGRLADKLAKDLEIPVSMAELWADYFTDELELSTFNPDLRNQQAAFVMPDLAESTFEVLPMVKGSYRANADKTMATVTLRQTDKDGKTVDTKIVYRMQPSVFMKEDPETGRLVADRERFQAELTGEYENGVAKSGIGRSYDARHGAGEWGRLDATSRRVCALILANGVNDGQEGTFEFTDGRTGETVHVDGAVLVSLVSGDVTQVARQLLDSEEEVAMVQAGQRSVQATVYHETWHALWKAVRTTLSDEELATLAEERGIQRTEGEQWIRDLDEAMAVEMENFAAGNYVSNVVGEKVNRFADMLRRTAEKIGLRRGRPLKAKVDENGEVVLDENGMPVMEEYGLRDFYDAVLQGRIGSGNLGIERVRTSKPGAETDGAKDDGEIPVAVTPKQQADKAEEVAEELKPAAPAAPEKAPAPIRAESDWDKGDTLRLRIPNKPGRVVVRLKVVNIFDLLTSFSKEGTQKYQNRGDTQESKEMRARIAADPDFEQAGAPQAMLGGATIVVDKAGYPIVGNHRVDGIQAAYRNGTAANYRTRTIREAEARGIEIDSRALEAPILVAETVAIEDNDTLRVEELGEAGNTPTMRGFNVYEEAQNDAKVMEKENIVKGIVVKGDGSIDSANSLPAVKNFIDKTGAQGVLDDNAVLTEYGQTRIGSAIMAMLVGTGENSRELLKKLLAEKRGLDIENETKALVKVAPTLLRLAKERPNYDLRAYLTEALAQYVSWRDADEAKRAEKGMTQAQWFKKGGYKWSDYSAQQDLFVKASPEADAIASRLAEARGLRSFAANGDETAAGQERAIRHVTDWFNKFVERAMKIDVETDDMFGTPPASPLELMKLAFSVARTTRLAPNGKRSNLTDAQYDQVRTPAFKAWFGDWEKRAKLMALDSLDPVAVTDRPVGVSVDEAYAALGEGVNSTDGRRVRFVNSTLGKIIRHKGYDTSRVVHQLKDVFERAVPLVSEAEKEIARPDGTLHKRHPNFAGYHTYVGKIEESGTTYYVRFTVQEEKTRKKDYNPNALHSTFVSDVTIYNSGKALSRSTTEVGESELSRTDGILSNILADFNRAAKGCSVVVDENGEPLVVYHGSAHYTPDEGFHTFATYGRNGSAGAGAFFTDNYDVAAQYAKDGKPYAVFLNIRNPKTHDWNGALWGEATDEEAVQKAEQEYIDRTGDEELTEFEPDYSEFMMSTDDFSRKARGEGRDGAAMYRVMDEAEGDNTINSADVYTVFDPNQVKSAVDNNGDFSRDNDDIRYSVAMMDEAARRNDLLAVHNVNVGSIRKIAEMGGFAMPSIAVVRDGYGHREFGDCTILFDKSTIDPKENRQNALYSHDAWTPSFPEIHNRVDISGIKSRNSEIVSVLSDSLRRVIDSDGYNLYYPEGIQKAFDTAEDAADAYAKEPLIKAAYLKSKGEEVEPVIVKKNYFERKGIVGLLDEHAIAEVVEKFGDRLIAAVNEGDTEKAYETYQRLAPEISRLIRSERPVVKRIVERKGDQSLDYLDVSFLADIIWRIDHDKKKGTYGESVADHWKTVESIDGRVNAKDPEYRAWVNAQYRNPIVGKGVYNGKPRRTDNGNVRRWESLHDPATLENIVRAMRKTQRANGVESPFGRNPFGVAVRRFMSIGEMKSHEGVLQPLTRAEEAEIKDALSKRLSDILTECQDSRDPKRRNGNALDERFHALDIMFDAWESSRGNMTKMQGMLNQYGYTAGEDLTKRMMRLFDDISMMATNYFEAKPQRAVRFDEMKAWIVPDTITPDDRKTLEDNGQRIYTYKAGDEADRLRAVNSAADDTDTRFSVASAVRGLYHGSAANWDVPSLDFIGRGQGQAVQGHGLNVTTDRGMAEVWGRLAKPVRPRNFLEKVGMAFRIPRYLYETSLKGANVIDFYGDAGAYVERLRQAVRDAGLVQREDWFDKPGHMKTVQGLERFLTGGVKRPDGVPLTPVEKARLMARAGIDANVIDTGATGDGNAERTYVVYNLDKLTVDHKWVDGRRSFSVARVTAPVSADEFKGLAGRVGTVSTKEEESDFACWMIPDGRLLKPVITRVMGQRCAHHDSVFFALGRGENENTADNYLNMLNGGAVRIKRGEGIEVMSRPTEAQLDTLYDVIERLKGTAESFGDDAISVDVDDPTGGTLFTASYGTKVSPVRILHDVRDWFDRGIVPENAVGSLAEKDGRSYSVGKIGADEYRLVAAQVTENDAKAYAKGVEPPSWGVANTLDWGYRYDRHADGTFAITSRWRLDGKNGRIYWKQREEYFNELDGSGESALARLQRVGNGLQNGSDRLIGTGDGASAISDDRLAGWRSQQNGKVSGTGSNLQRDADDQGYGFGSRSYSVSKVYAGSAANDDMRYSVSVADREKLKANFRDAKGVEEAGQVLRSAGVIGKPLRNDKLGMTVTISGNDLSKMTSEKATSKSVSARLHALAVANADTIFEAAFVEATHPDTHGRAEVIATHRIGSAIYDGENDRYEPALITVLEYMKHGKKMYSIEAIDIGKYKNSAGQLVVVTKGGIQTPIAEFVDIIAQTVAKVNGGDPRFSISSVYTGSAADYDRPSLIHVGTGEGSQVYGWGLYGSTVRGIAEGYAGSTNKGDERQVYFDGKPVADDGHTVKSLAAFEFRSAKGDVDKAIGILEFDIGVEENNARVLGISPNEKKLKRLRDAIELLRGKGSRFSYDRHGYGGEYIYEQTFFTNREPGDESHLLSHYEKITAANARRVIQAIETARKDLEDQRDFDVAFSPSWKTEAETWTGGQAYDMLTEACLLAYGDDAAKRASELLAKNDIDGIKYPADSYGGKTVKDGDKVGWNYVSFRDDNIRVDHKWVDGFQRYSVARSGELNGLPHVVAAPAGRQKRGGTAYPDAGTEVSGLSFSIGAKRRDAYRELFYAKRPDIPPEDVMAYLDVINGYDDPKKERLAVHWLIAGSIELPDDGQKLDKAIATAERAKVDPFLYPSPEDIFAAFPKYLPREKPVDPDTVAELTNRTPVADGIVVYDVSEEPVFSEYVRKQIAKSDPVVAAAYRKAAMDHDEYRPAGQVALRKVINSHWGKDANPWCLATADENGELDRDSLTYWKRYGAMPKKVAFRNGRLLAFMATDKAGEVKWWDRTDRQFDGIPVSNKIPGDALGRSCTTVYCEDGTRGVRGNSWRGNRQSGLYEEWNPSGELVLRAYFANGIARNRVDWADGKVKRVDFGGVFAGAWNAYGRPTVFERRNEFGRTVGESVSFRNDRLEKYASYRPGEENAAVRFFVKQDPVAAPVVIEYSELLPNSRQSFGLMNDNAGLRKSRWYRRENGQTVNVAYDSNGKIMNARIETRTDGATRTETLDPMDANLSRRELEELYTVEREVKDLESGVYGKVMETVARVEADPRYAPPQIEARDGLTDGEVLAALRPTLAEERPAAPVDDGEDERPSYSVANRRHDWSEYKNLHPTVIHSTSHIHLVGHDDPQTHRQYEAFKVLKNTDPGRAFREAKRLADSIWAKERYLGKYLLGKHFGQLPEAMQTARHFYSHANMDRLREIVGTERPVLWVYVHNTDGMATNMIPYAFAVQLSEDFGGDVASNIWKKSDERNTGADMRTRAGRNFEWCGRLDLSKNPKVFIVDDVWTTGSTTVSLLEYLHGQGADVHGIVTLAVASNTDHIVPQPADWTKALTKSRIHDVNRASRVAGLNLRRLTGSELYGYAVKGGAGSAGLAAWFEGSFGLFEIPGGIFADRRGGAATPEGVSGAAPYAWPKQEALSAAFSVAFPRLDRLSDDELIVSAIAAGAAINPRKANPNSKLNTPYGFMRAHRRQVEELVRRAHPEFAYDDAKVMSHAGMLVMRAQMMTRDIAKQLEGGADEAEILRRLPKKMEKVYRREMFGQRQAGGQIMGYGVKARQRLEENWTKKLADAVSVQAGIDSDLFESWAGVDFSDMLYKVLANPRELKDGQNAPVGTEPPQTAEDERADDGPAEENAPDGAETPREAQVEELEDPRRFAEYLSGLAWKYWRKEKGVGQNVEPWSDALSLQFMRRTAQNVYRKLVKDIVYSGARETANRYIDKFDAIPTYPGLVSAMTFVGEIIHARHIRETKQQMLEQLDNFLKLKLGAQGRFKPDQEELRRKVSAELELRARYMRHAMWLTPEAAADEAEGLNYTLNLLATRYGQNGRDVEQNREWREVQRNLGILREFGSLRYRTLGEIENAVRYWEAAAEGSSDQIVQAMQDREICTQNAANALAAAVANPNTLETVERGPAKRLNDFMTGHMGFVALLQDMIRYAKGAVREAAQEIVEYVALGVQRSGDRAATEKRRHADQFYAAVRQIYGQPFNKVMARMNERDDRFYPFMGLRGGKKVVPTRARAMQLLVSCLQGRKPGDCYFDNVVRHDRQTHAARIARLLDPADLAMIRWMSDWYENNRRGLSEVAEALFGMGVYSESVNYFPVKMMREKQGLEAAEGVGWSVFPKALTPRVKNERDFDTSADIFSMWMSRMEEGAQWKAHAKLGLELRGIFGRSELQEAIVANHGEKVNRLVQQFITDILTGESGADRSESGVGAAADEIRGWTALTALGGNFGVTLKQTTSIPAFGFEIGLVNTARHIVTAFTPSGMEAMAKIWNSEQRKTRWSTGNSEAVANALAQRNAGALKRLAQASMITNKIGDCVPALIVGQGIYRDLTKSGLSEENAMAVTWMLVERTQQSSRLENQPTLQRRNKLGRILYQFLSTQQQYLQYEMMAVRKLKADPSAKSAIGLIRVLALNHFILPSLYFWMGELWKAMLGSEPPEDRLTDLLITNLLGPFGSLFVLGFCCKYTLERALKGKQYGKSSDMLPMEGFIKRNVEDAASLVGAIFDAEGDWDQVLDQMARWAVDMNPTFRDLQKIDKNYLRPEAYPKK